jgi:hypothetical protein
VSARPTQATSAPVIVKWVQDVLYNKLLEAKMTEQQNDSIAFVIGCLFGLTLGLGVGMLYAPRQGRVTRRFVAYEAKRAKKKASEVIDRRKQPSD